MLKPVETFSQLISRTALALFLVLSAVFAAVLGLIYLLNTPQILYVTNPPVVPSFAPSFSATSSVVGVSPVTLPTAQRLYQLDVATNLRWQLPTDNVPVAAFSSLAATANAERVVVSTGGRFSQLIFTQPNDPLFSQTIAGDYPAWSADGTRLAYCSPPSRGNRDLEIRDMTTNTTTRINRGRDDDCWPTWSPDGTQLAFGSQRDDGPISLYIVTLADNSVRRVTQDEYDNIGPRWSPDGTRIAYHSERNGNFDLYSIAIDGTDEQRHTDVSSFDVAPIWTSDGRGLVFISDRNGTADMYLLTLADGRVQRLADSVQYGIAPVWLP
jgi:WD40 repeat protein